MSVTVLIPRALRPYIEGQAQIEVEASTVREALEQLGVGREAVRVRLFDKAGEMNRFIVVLVNGENIRWGRNLDELVTSEDKVEIVVPSTNG